MPLGGTIDNENYSPPLEGVQGWVDRSGRTHPEGYAFCPPRRGFSGELFMPYSRARFDENMNSPFEGVQGDVQTI